MSYDLLPVDIANIKADSAPATKEAHLERLKAELPDPVSFGDGFTQFGLKGGCALSSPIVTSAEVQAVIAKKEAEERAAREAEIEAKLAAEKRAKEAAEREAERRRRHRQKKHDERMKRRQLELDELE